MKRLIAAAILALVVTGLYLTSYFYITDTCDKTKELLKECITAYENKDNPEEKAEKLDSFWGKKEPLLSVFASHSKIDDIEEAIYCLKIYSKTDEKEIFYEYHGTVKILIHQLLEDTIPGVHSIL